MSVSADEWLTKVSITSRHRTPGAAGINTCYNLPMRSGLVYIFTGEGKGKTSAAIGTAVRAAGAGLKVAWVGWYKQESWQLSEIELLRELGVDVNLTGKGFYVKKKSPSVTVTDYASETEHKMAGQEALENARKMLGEVDVLIMDEVNNAVADKLINLIDLIDLISKRGKTHLILTGRDADPEIIKFADLVTEMKKIKHPYDKGNLAIRGLDF
jgi:cob(I)alamin adenosyltransferase